MSSQPSQSPLRLNTPSPQMYETSPGESAVLRGINDQNLGMMYSMLLGQRTDNQNRQYDYEQQLAGINDAQRGIAQQSLANDERDSQRKAITALVEHGGLSSGAAMSGLDLSGLPAFLNRSQTVADIEGTDAAINGVRQAKAYQDANQGAYYGVQAGLLPTPGQRVPTGATGALSLNRSVGTPLSLTQEGMQQAGRARATAAGLGKVTGRFNPITQETEYTATGSAEQVENALNPLRQRSAQEQPTSGAGPVAAGNQRVQAAANRGVVVNTPAPTSGNNRPTQAQRAVAEQQLGSPVRNYIRDPNTGRMVAVGTNGRTVEVK